MALSVRAINEFAAKHNATTHYHTVVGGQTCEVVSRDGRLIAEYYVKS